MSLRHFLRFIEQVGKVPAMVPREILHRARTVLWVSLDVVGIDRHGVDSVSLDHASKFPQRIGQMHHEWAVIAGKHHQQAMLARQFGAADPRAVRIR